MGTYNSQGQYTEATEVGFLGKLIAPFKGVLSGIALVFLSFSILWWNEGRTDMSEVAKLSTAAPAAQADPALEGRFVSVTAPLQTDATLQDPDFLQPVQALSLHREVQMYAWVESSQTRKEKTADGKTVSVTTYSYQKQWTSSPPDSGRFKDPLARARGYVNPELRLSAQTWTAESASVGAYGFDPREAVLPDSETLLLTEELLRRPATAAARPDTRIEQNRLFLGRGTADSPAVGDVRIGYRVVRPGAIVTMFGQQQGAGLVAYAHETGDRMFRAVPGAREAAIERLAFEHQAMAWTLRITGFFLMWMGLGLLLSPVQAALGVLPFLEGAGRFLVSAVTFPVALVLTIVTAVLSILAHSPVIFLLLVGSLGGGFLLARRRAARRRAEAAPETPARPRRARKAARSAEPSLAVEPS